MPFTNFDSDLFLRDYWQKKPLLIRNPWRDWQNPLAPDDFAGLACEDDIESRLIVQANDTWTVEHGPIPDTRFGSLSKHPWTLLVQAVDHVVPEVAALIEPFRFIPNWRIDDVMVSYATDGGGVGPHFDQYDVFLIQGLGQRRWQVGAHGERACTAKTPLLPHDDLRLLATFTPVDEWLLNLGDILYVPPGVAHNGVAVGDDCMTYSIGFRAPARSELIAHYCDHLLAELHDDDRYSDPDLHAQTNPGEISYKALARLHAMITDKLNDRAAFARWFGVYNSTPKYPVQDYSPEQEASAADIQDRLATGDMLTRNPASRFAFVRLTDDTVTFFVDGESYECAGHAAELAMLICAKADFIVPPDMATDDAVTSLLLTLHDLGAIAFADDD